MPIDPERLAAIRSRLAAAIPGPWKNVGANFIGTVEDDPQTVAYSETFVPYVGHVSDHRNRRAWTVEAQTATAEFIACAPEDVAYLLSLVEEVRRG